MSEEYKEDFWQVRLLARNCVLREDDPGPALLNVGSRDDPRLVPRSEAWQHTYAMHVLVDLEGDHARITSAGRSCRKAVSGEESGSWQARELSRSGDLCDQAAAMLEGAGAIHDDKARRRILAACGHETMVTALGLIPGIAEDSAQELRDTLREIDDEP
jgi:hypothetical protein